MLTTTTTGPCGATPGSQTNSPGLRADGGVLAGLDSLAPQKGSADEGPAASRNTRNARLELRMLPPSDRKEHPESGGSKPTGSRRSPRTGPVDPRADRG